MEYKCKCEAFKEEDHSLPYLWVEVEPLQSVNRQRIFCDVVIHDFEESFRKR